MSSGQYVQPWPSTTVPATTTTTEHRGVGAPEAASTLPRTGVDLITVTLALTLVVLGLVLLRLRKARTRQLQ